MPTTWDAEADQIASDAAATAVVESTAPPAPQIIETAGPPAPGAPAPTVRRRGRPPGSRNQVTLEAKRAAQAIVRDPIYRRKLLARAVAGTLHPGIEQMLWAYAYGKPHDTVRHTGQVSVPVRIVHEHQIEARAVAREVLTGTVEGEASDAD